MKALSQEKRARDIWYSTSGTRNGTNSEKRQKLLIHKGII